MEQSYPGFAVLMLVILPLVWWGTEKKIRAALLAPDVFPQSLIARKKTITEV